MLQGADDFHRFRFSAGGDIRHRDLGQLFQHVLGRPRAQGAVRVVEDAERGRGMTGRRHHAGGFQRQPKFRVAVDRLRLQFAINGFRRRAGPAHHVVILGRTLPLRDPQHMPDLGYRVDDASRGRDRAFEISDFSLPLADEMKHAAVVPFGHFGAD